MTINDEILLQLEQRKGLSSGEVEEDADTALDRTTEMIVEGEHKDISVIDVEENLNVDLAINPTTSGAIPSTDLDTIETMKEVPEIDLDEEPIELPENCVSENPIEIPPPSSFR